MNIIKIADQHVLLAGISNLRIRDVTALMSKLRSVNKRVAIQAVNANFVASMQHVLGVLYQSIEAKKRGTLLSKGIEVDILLRLACTDQIDKALTYVGLRNGLNNVLVIAVGGLCYLKIVRKYILANYCIDDNILVSSTRRQKMISLYHCITKTELGALVNNSNKLAGVLVEHASLL
ncbi:MAG: KEOPS complex subunit Cgi121 [Nitrososphaerales archaeon]